MTKFLSISCICLSLVLCFVFFCGFVSPASTSVYNGILVGSGSLNGLSCTYYLTDYSGICQGTDRCLFNTGVEKMGALLAGGREYPFRLITCSSSLLVSVGEELVLYNIVIDTVPAVHTVDTVMLVFLVCLFFLLIFLFVISRGVIL